MNARAIESDVTLARSGDEAAFNRLVAGSANTVCSIALAIVRNVEASEDVAQETFIAAWRGLRSLRNPSSFLPWLRQVARNQAHLWRREHGREITDEAVVAAAGDGRPSAEEIMVRSEEERLLYEVMDAMEADDREVLVLYYREEQSTRQVAALLEISEEAVRQRVARARSRLREEMLERFGRSVARTAPGATFGAAVAAALTISAPTASAAIASSTAATAALGVKGAMALASLAGAILGGIGVVLGISFLDPVFDEQETRELKRFRNTVLLIILAGSVVIALSRSSKWPLLIAMLTIYIVLISLYAVWMPRILERRMAWEKSLDPELARQTRRQWMWATISRAASAAIGGAGIMIMVLSGGLG